MKFFNRWISFFLLSILFLAVNTSSCKKFVQIPPGSNLIVSSQVFADSIDANSAVLGLYTEMLGSPNAFITYNGNITLFAGLSADELYSTTGNSSQDAAYVNAFTSQNVPGFWNDSYSVIYQANAIIEGLSSSTGLSTTAKNQFVGEAKVIRSFCYFHLVNLFGAVPLVTTINYQSNAVLPRTSVDSVYQQIIEDLSSSEAILTPNYLTEGKVRVNQYTATALLARVYLYRQNWKGADSASSAIINSGIYNLVPNLNNVFLAGSDEAILQLLPIVAGTETTEGQLFNPSGNTVVPSYVVDSFLLNTFETGDQRKVDWLDSNVVNGVVYYYPYKYKLGDDNTTTPLENYMIFRLGEQYLIRAEAEAEESDLSDAAADLDIIRTRAGLPGISNSIASSQASLVSAILHERRVELFCEWGHRWYDLKRTGNVNSIMGAPGNVCAEKGGSWNADWQFYPLELSQLQANPFLVQNQGY